MSKLAIIHTTPVTVESLKTLAAELGLQCDIVNFVDDSVLPQLVTNGGEVSEVAGRLIQYAKFAEQVGADVILSACSSVGEVVAAARDEVSIPIVRIDDAMAEEAVRRGTKIGVAATLRTTLNPTMNLLHSKAELLGKQVELVPLLAEDAYLKMLQGDREAHDSLLLASLQELTGLVDVVVLAQASMSRVTEKMTPEEHSKILSSPALAMQKVKQLLQGSR